MIYDCFQQVAHLSEAFTLEPGDVIATGTPAGIGAVRQPFPEGLLKVGDVVRIEIDGIGELRNTVVEEPEGYLAPEAERGAGMGALTPELREFLDANRVGVLATVARRRQAAAVARLLRARRRPAADLDARRPAQGPRRPAHRLGVALRDGPRAALPVGDVLGPRRDPHRGHRPATAAIAQRITGAPEPPEPMSDEALAEVGRVILAIDVERVTAVSYIPESTASPQTG